MTQEQQLPDIAFPARALDRSDAELWAACRQGDASAWDELVNRYQRLICTVPRRAGLSEDLVNEVFQEVILTLLEKLDGIEQPERLRAWLVTTAKYKSWKLLGQNRSFRQHHVESDDETLPMVEPTDETPLPDAVLVELEEQHLVRTAVKLLDARCQTIIGMLFYADEPHSYPEVAAVIGVNPTSISPLRARCLKKLARLMTQ